MKGKYRMQDIRNQWISEAIVVFLTRKQEQYKNGIVTFHQYNSSLKKIHH